MRTDLPIACSLSAAEQSSRLADMRAVGHRALLAAETTGGRATLRFRAGAGARKQLAAIVAAEAECCPFLDLKLREAAGVISLTVTAPAGAEPILAELVGAFDARAGAA
jgi:hypothetical protein